MKKVIPVKDDTHRNINALRGLLGHRKTDFTIRFLFEFYSINKNKKGIEKPEVLEK
ncbi:MAG: hypothetical protein ACOC2U_01755 [bacterium]